MNKVTCPAGGRYTYHPAGEEPECSVHGTASQQNTVLRTGF